MNPTSTRPPMRRKPSRRAAVRAGGTALLPLVSLALFSACGTAADSATTTATAVDSAGVQIVTSSGPAWGEGEEWRVGGEPTLEIGMAEGPNAYLLSGVQAAIRRDDGTLVLANGQTAEIRFYDPSGTHLATVGGKGGGPGEFQTLMWMGLVAGDSIAAYDASSRRLSLFSPQGDFVRAVTADAIEGGSYPLPVGLLSDRSLVAMTFEFSGQPPRANEVTQTPELLLRFGPDGALVDTVGRLLGPETLVQGVTSANGMNLVMMSTPLFGRAGVKGVVGDRVVVGLGDVYELQVLMPDGRPERVIRRALQPRPVTEEMLAAARLERTRGVSSEEERARRDRSLREAPHGSTVPFYDRIMGDDEGNLWVQDFTVPGEGDAAWSVFDPEGHFLGPVRMPPGLRVTHIGGDFVVGVVRDELDVERVRVYSLEKP